MKVAVLGGGVAGLSAAQELAERGCDVEIFERRPWYGGKARSVDIPGTGTPGRRLLPGEHGFRFFPGWYQHLDDTMKRIPFGDRTVLDNLVPASKMLLARRGASDIELPSETPDTPAEIMAVLRSFAGSTGVPFNELTHFFRMSMTFLTSCEGRRFGQWEHVSWWDFLDADSHSEPFRKLLAQGATRSLVAMRAEDSSTRTIGTIYMQMFQHLLDPRSHADRVLNGPTNERWLIPWLAYLQRLGVQVHLEHEVTEILLDGARVEAAMVESGGVTRRIEADAFVLAVPVEVVRGLRTPELLAVAPSLGRLDELRTNWMNGVQLYLDRQTPISNGHGLYLDSPWALTSISQQQFWEEPLDVYGDGTVKEILSVVISDWDTPGWLFGRAAKDCTPEQIRDEVWHELVAHLNDDALKELGDARILDFFVDDSIRFPASGSAQNDEPLLINTVGSWAARPESDIGLANLFLASDYVRTNTDLATMEAANEAARRAANHVLEALNFPGPRCDVWPLSEPSFLAPFKRLDEHFWEEGAPHVFEYIGFPW